MTEQPKPGRLAETVMAAYGVMAKRAEHDLKFEIQNRYGRALNEEELLIVENFVKDTQLAYAKLASKASKKIHL